METRNRLCFSGHDIFLIPSNDKTFLLYAPTLKRLFRITERLASRVSTHGLDERVSDTDLSELASLMGKSLSSAIEPLPMHLRKSKFFHLALGLTKNCTLACLYCHADAGIREDMSPEILTNAIQHAFDTCRRNSLKGINISFAVGGEPTTNWGLFTSCIREIKESEVQYGIPVHLSITTNGYYGIRKRQFLVKFLNSVLLSLDGPPDIQNLHRPSRNGAGSYQLARESGSFFVKNMKSFAIRSTVSNHNVQRMPEIVDLFYREFGNGYDLVFEPLVPMGRANANTALVAEPSQEDFVRYYILAKELGESLGLGIMTSAANHRRLVTSFCGAMSIPSFTVTTKGVVTTCERDSDGNYYSYGQFSPNCDEFILNEHRIKRNKAMLRMPEKCDDCFCKWHCAGDCPDIRSIGYDRCYVNQHLVQYELESLLKNAAKEEKSDDRGE